MRVKEVFLPIILLSTQIIIGMRIELDEAIIAKLKPIPNAPSMFGDSKPNINAYKQSKRRFIGKMDSFGLIRYFSVKNNQEAEKLTQAARSGHGWDPEFFYYDSEDPIISIVQIAPNIMVISDDNSE